MLDCTYRPKMLLTSSNGQFRCSNLSKNCSRFLALKSPLGSQNFLTVHCCCCCTSNASVDQIVLIFNFLDLTCIQDSEMVPSASSPEQGYNELKKSQQQEIQLFRRQITKTLKWLHIIFKKDTHLTLDHTF